MKPLFLGLTMFVVTAFGADTAAVRSDAVGRFSGLQTGTPQEKAELAQAMGYAKDADAVDALAKAALDSDATVAYAAADALGAIGTAKAADALLAALKSGSLDALAGGVLRCAEAQRVGKDAARAKALFAVCFAKSAAKHKAAALLGLARLEPAAYAGTVAQALKSDDPVMARAAAAAVEAESALAPIALTVLPELKDEAKAQVLFALIPHAEAAGVKPVLLAALTDESLPVRMAGLRAAVSTADGAALPALFALTVKPEEEGLAANFAMAAMSAKETDAYLYGEMRKEGTGRVRAIGLLTGRGQAELVPRLCDASLYAVAGVSSAAGDAFRAGVRQETFAQALAFVFGPLPAALRDPPASALASVAQQLPDQGRVLREIGDQLVKTEVVAKPEVLGLLAGLQTEGARDLLAAQAKSSDVELRKTVVRVFCKWSTPLALSPLLDLAKQDPERSVRILAARGLLALMQKPALSDTKGQLALLADLAVAAERAEEKRAIYDRVKAIGGKEAEALRIQLAEACGIKDVGERVVKAVNAGGDAVGVFSSDSGFKGGSKYAVTLDADVTDAVGAAPEEVYQTSRYGEMSYTFDGLNAGQAYVLRLHFAEPFHSRPGRVCDVLVNGKAVLTDYDIFAKTGKKMKAITERVEVTADAAGRIEAAFKTKSELALVSGLELLETEAGRQRTKDGGQ